MYLLSATSLFIDSSSKSCMARNRLINDFNTIDKWDSVQICHDSPHHFNEKQIFLELARVRLIYELRQKASCFTMLQFPESLKIIDIW